MFDDRKVPGTRAPLARKARFAARAAAAAATCALSLSAMACGSSSTDGSGSGDGLAAAKKAGYIRVGFANENPYGYADATGKLTGEAPAVGGAVMKGLGVDKLDGNHWGGITVEDVIVG